MLDNKPNALNPRFESVTATNGYFANYDATFEQIFGLMKLYHHSFAVSGAGWETIGINLILPTSTKFTARTFAGWLYRKGYRAYNRSDTEPTCLWLAGANFGAGGAYGTPLAVFSPDGTNVKVQISGNNTLSDRTCNTIFSYSVREIFSDSMIS